MKHTTKIEVLPLNESTCIQMFPVISGENIRCRLRIYLGHVSPSCVLKGVLHGSFPKSRLMQMGPSGSIAKFCHEFFEKNLKKIHLLATSITKEFEGDRFRTVSYFCCCCCCCCYCYCCSDFFGLSIPHKNTKSILIDRNYRTRQWCSVWPVQLTWHYLLVLNERAIWCFITQSVYQTLARHLALIEFITR